MHNERLKKIECFNGVLLDLSPESHASNDKRPEVEVVCDLVKKNHPIAIQRAIKEDHEVLAIEPFPWEWVRSAFEGCVYDEEKREWVDDHPVLYRKWLTKVVDMLEKEAKKQGKLISSSST